MGDLLTPMELDRRVHEPARLAVLLLLAAVGDADFVFVQRRVGLTAGNLATHLAKLEAAGFVRGTKSFEGRRPCTLLVLTDAGRTALMTWRKQVSRLMNQ